MPQKIIPALAPAKARATSRRASASMPQIPAILSGGKPFALCGVPSALGGQVKPGAKLAVEGYATRFGFHYKTVRPAP